MINLRKLEKGISEISNALEMKWSKQFCPIPKTKDMTEVVYLLGGQILIHTGRNIGIDCNDNETPESAYCDYISIDSKSFRKPSKLILPEQIGGNPEIQLANFGNYYWYQIFKKDDSNLGFDIVRLIGTANQYTF
jgi:hypothetical protein